MPPPSGNENQGLKIAVACFVMLSVILAVTTYFGFKNYYEYEAKFTDAEKATASAKKGEEDLTRVLNDFRDKAGFPKTDIEGLPKAADKAIDDLQKKAVAARDAAVKAIDTAKSSGASLGGLDEARQSLETIITGIQEPNRTLASTADRYAELTANLGVISTLLAAEFETTRKTLEDTNNVNRKGLDVAEEGFRTAKADLEGEISKHENDRQVLGSKVQVLQDDTSRQAQEIARLKNENAQLKDESEKRIADLRNQLGYFRDITERKETVLGQKDGTLTFVDYTQGEVRVDLTRGQGAREQMVFTVFDRSAPGLPSDRPKGTIELIQVGANGSVGRIVKTERSIEPMRTGDQVYSPSWDSNDPKQFALIGKMDINRDGRDDREDLKRLIRASGGTVTYDLPPANVGSEQGKLTPRIAWYVVDDQEPFRPINQRESKNVSSEDTGFLTKRTEAIRTARADGIRPKSLSNLLKELGYSYSTAPSPGRVEAIDREGVNRLVNPNGRPATPPPTEGSGTEDEPK